MDTQSIVAEDTQPSRAGAEDLNKFDPIAMNRTSELAAICASYPVIASIPRQFAVLCIHHKLLVILNRRIRLFVSDRGARVSPEDRVTSALPRDMCENSMLAAPGLLCNRKTEADVPNVAIDQILLRCRRENQKRGIAQGVLLIHGSESERETIVVPPDMASSRRP